MTTRCEDVERRLSAMISTTLNRTQRHAEKAVTLIMRELESSMLAECAIALIGRDEFIARLTARVEARRVEMSGRVCGDGVSHGCSERQNAIDRPIPAPSVSSRPSLRVPESHASDDRPAAPSMSSGGEGQRNGDSLHCSDLPAASAPAKPAKGNAAISSAAAITVARSIYDRNIGPPGITFRKADRFAIINAHRAGSRYTKAMHLLLTRNPWPKGALLPDVYTERELGAILEEADRALPPISLIPAEVNCDDEE